MRALYSTGLDLWWHTNANIIVPIPEKALPTLMNSKPPLRVWFTLGYKLVSAAAAGAWEATKPTMRATAKMEMKDVQPSEACSRV